MNTDVDLQKITETFEKIIKQQNEFFLKELDKRFTELEKLKSWQKEIRMQTLSGPR